MLIKPEKSRSTKYTESRPYPRPIRKSRIPSMNLFDIQRPGASSLSIFKQIFLIILGSRRMPPLDSAAATNLLIEDL